MTAPLVLCLHLLLLIELFGLHPRMTAVLCWRSLFVHDFLALLIVPRVQTSVVVQWTASGRDPLTVDQLLAHLYILPAPSPSLARLRASLNRALALVRLQGPTFFVLLVTLHRETAAIFVRRIGLSLVGMVVTAGPMRWMSIRLPHGLVLHTADRRRLRLLQIASTLIRVRVRGLRRATLILRTLRVVRLPMHARTVENGVTVIGAIQMVGTPALGVTGNDRLRASMIETGSTRHMRLDGRRVKSVSAGCHPRIRLLQMQPLPLVLLRRVR